MHIGGLAAVLASHIAFEFLAPVYIGDTITAICTVVEADPPRGWARLELICANQHGDQVARGEARGYPMRWKDRLRGFLKTSF
jgi:acyl dehydratase